MPAVPDSRLKGNYGAAVVMKRLSSESLVRPVAADTDVGVDLYCETRAQGRPFLHFWVQVKAGDQCKVDLAAKTASCRFECSQLVYWVRQPVPVFAALVPTEWPAQRDPDVYIVDITTQILFKGVPDSQSIILCSDYHWLSETTDCIQTFLTQVVPNTTARLQCSRGVVAASPTPDYQYVRKTPVAPILRFKSVITDQIRTTAANSILLAMAFTEQTIEVVDHRRLLARILEQFANDTHWETFCARAISSHLDQDFESALALYGEARASIQNDTLVRDEPIWRDKVRWIEKQEQRAREKAALGPDTVESK